MHKPNAIILWMDISLWNLLNILNLKFKRVFRSKIINKIILNSKRQWSKKKFNLISVHEIHVKRKCVVNDHYLFNFKASISEQKNQVNHRWPFSGVSLSWCTHQMIMKDKVYLTKLKQIQLKIKLNDRLFIIGFF